MFTVELYAGMRRAVMVDGLSRRDAAKRFGVDRKTIPKMLQFSVSLPSGLVKVVQLAQQPTAWKTVGEVLRHVPIRVWSDPMRRSGRYANR
jgi:hypothetical protein